MWQRLTAGPLAVVLVLGTLFGSLSGFFAPAGASTVSNVQVSISSVAPSSNVVGNPTATYSVLFKTTTALTPTTTVTLQLPKSTPTAFSLQNTYTFSCLTATCVSVVAGKTTVNSNPTTGKLVVKFDHGPGIPAGTKVLWTVPHVRNPRVANDYAAQVSTSKDVTPVTSTSYAIKAGVPTHIKVQPSNSTGPASTTANIGAYKVTLRDQFTNPTRGATPVTLALITSTPTHGVFSKTLNGPTVSPAYVTITSPTGATFWYGSTKAGTDALKAQDTNSKFCFNTAGTPVVCPSGTATAVVTAGAAQKVTLTPGGTTATPASIPPGAKTVPITANFTDAFGNPVTSGKATFTLPSTTGATLSLSAAGTGTCTATKCTNVAVTAAGAPVNLTVGATANGAVWQIAVLLQTTSVTTTATYQGKAGKPTKLAFNPTPATAGTVTTKTGFAYTVEAQTALGNLATSAAFTVTYTATGTVLAAKSGFGTAATTSVGGGLTKTVKLVGGKATVYFGSEIAGGASVTVTAATGCGTTGTAACGTTFSTLNLAAGPAKTITATPASGTALAAGSTVTFTGTLTDAFGNKLAAKKVTFVITGGAGNSCGATFLTTCTVATGSGATAGKFSVVVHTATTVAAGSPFKVTITSGTATAFTGSYTLAAGKPTKLVFKPTPATTGTVTTKTGFAYTVEAQTALGNLATSAAFTVKYTAAGAVNVTQSGFGTAATTGVGGGLTKTVKLVGGKATVYFGSEIAGGDSVTVTAATGCGTTGTAACTTTSSLLTLAAGPAKTITLSAPTGTTLPAGSTVTFTGTLTDAFGNKLAAKKVNLAITPATSGNKCNGTFTTCTVTTKSGATAGKFSVTVHTASSTATGSPFTVTITSGTATAFTGNYKLAAGAPTKLVFKPAPTTTGTVTTKTAFAYTVEAQTSLGNLVTSAAFTVTYTATGTVTAAKSGLGAAATTAVGGGLTKTVKLSGGKATVYFGSEIAGSATVKVTAATGCGTTGTAACTTTSSTLTLAAGPAKTITLSAPAGTTLPAGSTVSFTGTLTDAFGNRLSTAPVKLAITPTASGNVCGATLTTCTLTTGSAGTAGKFAVRVHTANSIATGSPFSVTITSGTATALTKTYTLSAGAPTKLVFKPTPATAGTVTATTGFAYTVEAQTSLGNLATGAAFTVTYTATGTVTVAKSGFGAAAATAVGGGLTKTVKLAGGKATVYFGSEIAGSATVKVTAATGCGTTGTAACTTTSSTLSLTAGPAKAFTVVPPTGTAFHAGVAQNVTGTLADTFGNPVAHAAVRLVIGGVGTGNTFTTTGGCTANTTVCNVNTGTGGTFTVQIQPATSVATASPFTLTVSTTAGTAPTSVENYTVTGGPPVKLVFQNPPSATQTVSSKAGVAFTVAAEDQYGNVSGTAAFAVTFSAGGATAGQYGFSTTPNATLGTTTPATLPVNLVNGKATVYFGDRHADKTVTVMGNASTGCGTTGTTACAAAAYTLSFLAGPPTQVVSVLPTSPLRAGVSYPISGTVEDAQGNPVAANTAVTLALDAVTANATFSAPVACAGLTFCTVLTGAGGALPPVSMRVGGTLGRFTLRFTSGTTLSQLVRYTVGPGIPVKLAFRPPEPRNTQPVSTTTSVGPLTVAVEDVYGHVVPISGSVSVTASGNTTGKLGLSATSGASIATSQPPLSLTLSAGKADAYFGDMVTDGAVVFKATGAICGTAGTSNCTPATSQTFTFTPGPPATIKLAPATGGSFKVGSPLTSVATVRDAHGNLISTGSVTFTLNGTSGTAFPTPACSSATTCTVPLTANGTASVSYTVGTKAGTGNLSITAVDSPATDTAVYSVLPGTPAKLTFTGGGATSGTAKLIPAGTGPVPLTATVMDKYTNPVPVVTVTVTTGAYADATLTGGSCVSPGTACTLVTSSNGQASVTFTAGGHTGPVTVKAAVASPALSASTYFSVVPAAPTQLLVKPAAASTPASATPNLGLSIVAADQFGNPTNAGATIIATPHATGPAAASFSPSTVALRSSGPVSFGATKVGSYVVTATATTGCGRSGATPCTAGSGSTVTVNPSSTTATYVLSVVAPTTTITATVGTSFTVPLQAKVVDKLGNPVPGVRVMFASPLSGASATFSGGAGCTGPTMVCTVVTNATGVATSPKPVANQVATSNPYLVRLTDQYNNTPSGSPSDYSLKNAAGSAAKLQILPATATGKASTTANIAYTVRALDAFTNPVVAATLPSLGLTVTLGATGPGTHEFTPATVKITKTHPVASFKFGSPKAGTYALSASSNQCGKTGSTPCTSGAATAKVTASTASSIAAVSGGGQKATVGTAFGSPLTAVVRDAHGNPVAGASVTFSVPASGASATFGAGCTPTGSTATACVVKTNTVGVATSPVLTANDVASSASYNVTATAVGVTGSATFALTNVAGTVAGLTVLPAPNTTGKASTTANILGYRVVTVDKYGNRTAPAPGVTVHVTLSTMNKVGFSTVFSPSNQVSITHTTTAAYFAFGATGAGSYTLDAVSANCGPTGTTACTPGKATNPATGQATVTAATAANLAYVSGSGQKAEAGTPFTLPLKAVVTDRFGNPVANYPVTFTGPPATQASVDFGAGATTLAVDTNATGIATTGTFSANNLASSNPYTVVATAKKATTGALSGSPVRYSLTNEPGKATYVAVTSTGSTIGKADTATNIGSYSVTLQDQNHNNITPATTVAVTLGPAGTCGGKACGFSLNTPGPFLTAPTVVHLNSATPSVTVYFGAETAGTYYLTGSATGLTSVPAGATVVPATPASIVPTGPPAPPSTPQKTTVGTSFSNPLSATVTDRFGNRVPGVTVTFAAPASGASATFSGSGCSATLCSETTNATGIATIPAAPVANTVAGPYKVRATTKTSVSTTFSLTNLAGPAVGLEFTTAPQTGPASSSPDLGPITVQLFDRYGNPSPIRSPTGPMTLTLSDNGYPNGKFATLSGNPETQAVIGVGTSSASFLFGSTRPGTAKITVHSTFGTISQTQVITTAAASKVVFTNAPLSGQVASSPTLGPATVEIEDAYGNVVTPSATVTVGLSGSGKGARFGAVQHGPTVGSAPIHGGQQTGSFWFGDTTAGTATVTATASVCGTTGTKPCTPGTQVETLTAGPPAALTVTPPAGGTATTPGGQPPLIRSNGGAAYYGVRSATANLGPFTVTMTDQFGNPTTSATPVTVSLTSTSRTAKFAATQDGTPVTTLTVPAGKSTVSFWYGDFSTGSATITVFSAGLVIGTQNVSIVAAPHQGYWLEGADGGIFAYGTSQFYGSAGGIQLAAPLVAFQSTPNGQGYWQFGGDGGVITWGNAQFYGSMGGKHLNAPVVGAARTPNGMGYWEVASDGGVFAFGDAGFYGSMGGKPLDQPVVGMAATPTGGGYWLVAKDGGVFSFGNAKFHGSTGGMTLNAPIVGMAATPTGGGYWLVASDGGVFAFGNAAFYGSAAGGAMGAPVVGISASPTGGGYWLVASNGAVSAYGDAMAAGSATSISLKGPIVAIGGS